MNKQPTTPKKPPASAPQAGRRGAPAGNTRAAKPPETRRVPLFVLVAPETKELLKPFAQKAQAGRIVDKAIAEYMERHAHE